MGADSYERLKVWQHAILLSKQVYRVTEAFPKSEMFGLTGQMRRSVVSVASNIAEGSARNSQKEFYHFIGIALGSLAELDTQTIISEGLFMDAETCSELRSGIKETRKMLNGLKSKVNPNNL